MSNQLYRYDEQDVECIIKYLLLDNLDSSVSNNERKCRFEYLLSIAVNKPNSMSLSTFIQLQISDTKFYDIDYIDEAENLVYKNQDGYIELKNKK